MNKKSNILIYVLLITIVLCSVLLFNKEDDDEIVFNYLEDKLILMIGDNKNVTPSLSKGDSSQITYVSSNPDIATIDNIGNIKAISKGICTVTATYNDLYTSIKVIVNKDLDEENPIINYDISNYENIWNTNDVIINLDVYDNEEVYSLEYSDNDNDYINILDTKKIVITENGIHNIKVICKDTSNNMEVKEFTIKVDKNVPNIDFSLDNGTYDKSDLVIKTNDTVSGIKNINIKVNYNYVETEYNTTSNNYVLKLDKDGIYTVIVIVEYNNLNNKTETKEYIIKKGN